jgi:hypothetical protein
MHFLLAWVVDDAKNYTIVTEKINYMHLDPLMTQIRQVLMQVSNNWVFRVALTHQARIRLILK